MWKNSRRSGESGARRGMTLLETVVAIAIVGSVLVGLLVARLRAFEAQRRAGEVLAAARTAASCVSALRAGAIGEGSGEGARPGPIEWSIARSEAPSDVADRLDSFTVRVRFSAGSPEGDLVLTVWLPKRPARRAR